MAKYIDREAAIYEMLEAMCGTGYQQWAIDVIKRQPTADVAEVVHGEWIPLPEYENKRCSVCRTVFSDFTLGYYCPNCGAKMDGKENTE